MKAFFEQVSACLRVSLSHEHMSQSLAPFACQILAFDQCTLDQVARWLEVLRTVKKGSSSLLAGQLNALFDLTMQQWGQVNAPTPLPTDRWKTENSRIECDIAMRT
jgi:hypothetical protein